MKKPETKTLNDALNAWPTGSAAHGTEEEAIATLNSLCNTFGYGRICQLAVQTEHIWREPDAALKYAKDREERLARLDKINSQSQCV
jgi:hypothetical protein